VFQVTLLQRQEVRPREIGTEEIGVSSNYDNEAAHRGSDSVSTV
jgi:hypothetical protein